METIFVNGRLYTVNADQPRAEAVAVSNGRISAVGSNADVLRAVSPGAAVVDLGEAFVMPGIHDAHVHPSDVYKHAEAGFLSFPESLGRDEIAKQLTTYVDKDPERRWIRAQKYGLGAFPGGKMTREFLDELIPDRPTIVYDEALHNAAVNTVAMTIAGITKETPDPPLGVIDRNPTTGEPTGYLSETAIELVGRHIGRVDEQSLKNATRRALAEMTAYGITAFIDMMVFEDLYLVYRDLDLAGDLPFRVVAALAMNEYTGEVVTPSEADELISRIGQYSTHRIDVGHFKYWADGTALSFTSLLIEPYTNDPSTHGSMTMTEEMRERAVELLGQGLAGHFHCTGDGTVREILNMIESAQLEFPGSIKRTHIGHNQIVHPDDVPRFKDLDVVAEFSPPQWFPTPMSPLIPSVFGDRTQRWMPIKEFVESGADVAIGSDWPAGTPTVDPWRSLQGLVTRRDPSGEHEGQLGDPIALSAALRAMTLGGAVAMGKELDHGSLELGKYADMIVLDRDLTTTPDDQLSETRVLSTIFGGKVVYEAGR